MLRHNRVRVTPLALILMFIGCGLYGVQALVWRSSSRGRTETDVENHTGHRRPTEAPILAGTALLVIAGVILCIPRGSDPD
jgi:hypothetical protein